MAIEYERVRFVRGTEEEIDASPDMMNCQLGFCTDTGRFVIRDEDGVIHKFTSSNDISDFIASKGQPNGLAPLDENGEVGVDISWGNIPDKPSTYSPTQHGAAVHSGTLGLYSNLSEIPGSFNPVVHGASKHSGNLGLYSDLSLIPSTFPPSAHGHDTIDSFIASKGQASGLAPLDSNSRVNSYVNDVAVTTAGSTTARNLSVRFGEVFNVRDYGAVGDGTTDDHAAILLALTAATSGNQCGVLYFPTGIYKTTGTYNLNNMNGLKIYGDGIRNSQIVIATASNDLFQVTRYIDGLEISGLTFTNVPIHKVAVTESGWPIDEWGYFCGLYMGGKRSAIDRIGGWVFNATEDSWIGFVNTFSDLEIVGQYNGIHIGSATNVRFFNIRGFSWSGPLKEAAQWQASHEYPAGVVVVSPASSNYWYYSQEGGISSQYAPDAQAPGAINDGGVKWLAYAKQTVDNVDNDRVSRKGWPSAWRPSTIYTLGQMVFNTNYWYYCTTEGTSGSSAPTFTDTPGCTVQDGSVVWIGYPKWAGAETGGVMIKLGKTFAGSVGWEALIDRCYCEGTHSFNSSMPTLYYGIWAQDTGCVRITNSLFYATVSYCVILNGSTRNHGVHYVSNCHFDSTATSHLFVNNSKFFTLSDSQFYDSGSISCGRATAVNKVGDSSPAVMVYNSDRNCISNCIIQNSMGDGIQLFYSSGTMTGMYIDAYGNGNVEGMRCGIKIYMNGSFGQGWVVSGCHVDNADPGRYPTPTYLGLAINTLAEKLVIVGNYFGELEWYEVPPLTSTITLWGEDIYYGKGNVVLYGVSYYRCIEFHQSDPNNKPGNEAVWAGPIVVNLHNTRDFTWS